MNARGVNIIPLVGRPERQAAAAELAQLEADLRAGRALLARVQRLVWDIERNIAEVSAISLATGRNGGAA